VRRGRGWIETLVTSTICVLRTCVVISMASRVAEQIARRSAYPRRMVDPEDRGPAFDSFRIGRPATGALLNAGYRAIADLPADLDGLLALHGVGPKAVRLLWQARAN
jgi:endonuclease III